MNRLFLIVAFLAAAFTASAETVLLYEDFNDNYTKSFPYVIDNDGLMPHSSIQSWFLSSSTGTYQPWWILRESASDPDKFIGSHSYYSPAGTSDDWLISVPLYIPSAGFVLTFDAQSVILRSGSRRSNLRLYITEDLNNGENLPQTPAMEWQNVPAGKTPDVTTDEWVNYSFELDDYVGKTIYLCFVNQNSDKDLLCLDNVKVARSDAAELNVTPVDRYITDAKYTIDASVTTIGVGKVNKWTVTFSDGKNKIVREGSDLEKGQTVQVAADFEINPDETAEYTVTLVADDNEPIVYTGLVSRLTFTPVARVLLEESTGLWCGYCPFGMYNIESLLSDSDYGDKVVPVSVHIPGTTYDMMTMEEYGNMLGFSSAPMVRINRQKESIGFSTTDASYDPTNRTSFAYRVISELQHPTLADISVEGTWVIEDGDTTAIECKATVRPALSMADSRYCIGFILTENNVGLDNSPYWVQHNYFAGTPYASRLGGWCDLEDNVMNYRFSDVARVISHFYGADSSLPTDLKAGMDYEFNYTITIPNTRAVNGSGIEIAPAIRREMCELTAFVIDRETGGVVNVARMPMSEKATKRFTPSDLLAIQAGIESVGQEDTSAPTYYNLSGVRVSSGAMSPGVYIVRKNGKTHKIMMK